MGFPSGSGLDKFSDLQSFIRASFPTHSGDFTTDTAIRVLAAYLSVSPWEVSRVVDMSRPIHNMENLEEYVSCVVSSLQKQGEVRTRAVTSTLTGRVGSSPAEVIHTEGNCMRSPTVKPHTFGKKKLCKQFCKTGLCAFGSRCLFHHEEPHRGDTWSVSPDTCITDRNFIEPKSTESSSRVPTGAGRELFTELASPSNNFSLPTERRRVTQPINKVTAQEQTDETGIGFAPPGTQLPGVYVMPLSVRSGELYVYTPVQFHVSFPICLPPPGASH
ncbi:zinc finger ccch domain-containing protein 14 [Trypanosoma brucei equiperdum]|uniref:Zinc finger ccch domain-containing protein 14 n=1 Tax=Trypanosoma brucei equiperdum TaxID=630700 RepID=A0A3L6L645_9TRYP|nr:zinc finger ccch domain-containing protein 14 [Trypanosoma brucei equiperdum]